MSIPHQATFRREWFLYKFGEESAIKRPMNEGDHSLPKTTTNLPVLSDDSLAITRSLCGDTRMCSEYLTEYHRRTARFVSRGYPPASGPEALFRKSASGLPLLGLLAGNGASGPRCARGTVRFQWSRAPETCALRRSHLLRPVCTHAWVLKFPREAVAAVLASPLAHDGTHSGWQQLPLPRPLCPLSSRLGMRMGTGEKLTSKVSPSLIYNRFCRLNNMIRGKTVVN